MSTPFNTTLDLMSGVPFDPQYRHTYLFANANAQNSYFSGRVIYSTNTFTNLSYQRYKSGSLKIQASIGIFDTVNYLRFRNNSHENKPIYAFITHIEYISDTVVRIDYQVDDIQTWMFDYTLNPCYVEREHTNNDAIGANRVNEGLDTGPYITPMIEKIPPWDSIYATESGDIIQNTTFIVIATQAPDGSQDSYQMNGVASSMYIRFAYDVAGLETILDSFRNGVTASLEPIVSIGMFPSGYKPNVNTPLNPITTQLTADAEVGLGPFRRMNTENPGYEKTYVPKNNKMYCYPYNYMTFESPDGSTVILKHEDFNELSSSNHHQQFVSDISVIPIIETTCRPLNYEHILQGTALTGRYMKYALFGKSYPYCPVASDAFSAWWAQNMYNNPVQAAMVDAADAVSSSVQSSVVPKNGERDGILGFMDRIYNGSQKVIDGLIGAFSGKTNVQLIGQLASTVAGGIVNPTSLTSLPSEIAGQNAAYKGHQAVPDTLVTKANNAGVNHYCENDCYKIHYTKITPEYAEIIDNYFSCFGYATHIVKVPNITGRLEWNYVQTKGCTISGNIPAEAEETITKIYDRGITFWHVVGHIHNYSLANPIV